MFAGVIATAMVGSLYAAASPPEPKVWVEPIVLSPTAPLEDVVEAPVEDAIPAGQDVPQEVAAMVERDEFVDWETGMRLGELTVVEPEEEEAEGAEEASTPATTTRRRASRSTPRPAPGPRLHPNPGMHVILTARRMNANGVRINGSCYRYISEVFERAGHSGWRNRRTVYAEHRNGPYADLGLVRPGDWLYIVNHPHRTPVGTHSVLFVGWQDRARGIAHVIEHPGWGAATTGRERTYDVSRTYRITRPTQ